MHTKAPEFSLTSNRQSTWRLSDHVGKVIALLFYPANETLVCNRQLCSIRDNWDEYLETKAEIVGISPGSPQGHMAFAQKRNLPLTILADPDRVITRLYGKHWLMPIGWTRAVVVIDAAGYIRSREVMFRGFRPSDDRVIADIYEARGDALNERYKGLKARIRTDG